jgi:hypothetical protein
MSKLRIFRGWNAILNVHERLLPVPVAQAGALLDSLSGPADRLWPLELWPPMRLNAGLAQGSTGGHSMIRYTVSEYVPGRRVEFEFQPMPHLASFRGRHYFEVLAGQRGALLRHTIDVETTPRTWLYWKLFVEHVHDAVLEDAFDKAERELGLSHPRRSRWSLHVRFLRWLRARRRAA